MPPPDTANEEPDDDWVLAEPLATPAPSNFFSIPPLTGSFTFLTSSNETQWGIPPEPIPESYEGWQLMGWDTVTQEGDVMLKKRCGIMKPDDVTSHFGTTGFLPTLETSYKTCMTEDLDRWRLWRRSGPIKLKLNPHIVTQLPLP